MQRRLRALRIWAIAAIIIGLGGAAFTLFSPGPSATARSPVAQVSTSPSARTETQTTMPIAGSAHCASPLSRGPATVATKGFSAGLDCAANISHRRWLAVAFGTLALLGLAIVFAGFGLDRDKNRADVSPPLAAST